MSEFNERERSEEKKFELDQELEFKAVARRNKQVGLWAAELQGLKGAEADAYATSVIALEMKASGEEDVFSKLKADFAAKGVAASDHLIRAKMSELLTQARDQLRAAR